MALSYWSNESIWLAKTWCPYCQIACTYLINRVQVTIVGSFYRKILDIIFGVLQGSSSVIQYKYNWLFLNKSLKSDFSNYVGNTAPYNYGNTPLELYQT